MERIKTYIDLLHQFPQLTQPEDSLIEVITDEKQILEWEEKNNLEIGVLLQDRFITVIRDLVQFSNGYQSGYNRIINTSAFGDGGMGSVVLPVKDSKVLMIKIFRHPIREWSIEIPRGFGEKDLSPLEIAHKEVVEEVGGKIREVIELGVIHSNTGLEGNTVNLYLAYLEKVGDPRVEEGIEKFLWILPSELERMIRDEEITDGFTIAAYTRAKLRGLL
jgi:ADP-ribose pyrophosphatase